MAHVIRVMSEEESVALAINRIRREQGVSAARLDERLGILAATHAAHILESRSLSHVGRDGSTPQQRAAAAGLGDGLVIEECGVSVGQLDDDVEKLTRRHIEAMDARRLATPMITDMGVAVLPGHWTSKRAMLTVVVLADLSALPTGNPQRSIARPTGDVTLQLSIEEPMNLLRKMWHRLSRTSGRSLQLTATGITGDPQNHAHSAAG